jgi:hypothetical protein
MLEGSPREQPTSLIKRLSANSKLKNGYNSHTHNHTKIDTRGNINPKSVTLVCTLVFKP